MDVANGPPNSADAVQRLRLVHLSLLALCFALLAITYYGTAEHRKAHEQIVDILDLVNTWQSKYQEVEQAANASVEQTFKSSPRAWRPPTEPPLPLDQATGAVEFSQPKLVRMTRVRMLSTGRAALPGVSLPETFVLRLRFGRGNWLVGDDEESSSRQSSAYRIGYVHPFGFYLGTQDLDTIGSFAGLWNALYGGPEHPNLDVQVPVELEGKLYTFVEQGYKMAARIFEWSWSEVAANEAERDEPEIRVHLAPGDMDLMNGEKVFGGEVPRLAYAGTIDDPRFDASSSVCASQSREQYCSSGLWTHRDY